MFSKTINNNLGTDWVQKAIKGIGNIPERLDSKGFQRFLTTSMGC
jgi:hypothetical protein